jgi:hypothetical protein
VADLAISHLRFTQGALEVVVICMAALILSGLTHTSGSPHYIKPLSMHSSGSHQLLTVRVQTQLQYM